MEDWADEIAEGLDTLSVLEMTDSHSASIAKALRKAKADGVRHAVDLIELECGYLPALLQSVRTAADQIEKGQ